MKQRAYDKHTKYAFFFALLFIIALKSSLSSIQADRFTIASIKESRHLPRSVYNIEVAKTHTYFVARQDILVHNKAGVSSADNLWDSAEVSSTTIGRNTSVNFSLPDGTTGHVGFIDEGSGVVVIGDIQKTGPTGTIGAGPKGFYEAAFKHLPPNTRVVIGSLQDTNRAVFDAGGIPPGARVPGWDSYYRDLGGGNTQIIRVRSGAAPPSDEFPGIQPIQ